MPSGPQTKIDDTKPGPYLENAERGDAVSEGVTRDDCSQNDQHHWEKLEFSRQDHANCYQDKSHALRCQKPRR